MHLTGTAALRIAIALGIGLLIGAERERRKGVGASRSPAGIRTFAIVSMLGAVSLQLGGEVLLAVITLAVAALAAIGYLRSRDKDPGLTSEAALLLTLLLGGLTVREPALASGLAVTVAILLAARARIHRFVRSVLTEGELHDALILAAAVLVILPLMPDRYLGPFGAINPRMLWKIVVLMISISAGGYIAVRLLGPRFGLPLSGLLSGFVSSTATIAAMGSRARQQPGLARPAVSAAVLSTVATILELAAVLLVTSRAVLSSLMLPLLVSGTAAVVYGVLFTLRSLRDKTSEAPQAGSAFSLKTALGFAAIMATVLLLSAALNSWMGSRGVLISSAVAGFADAHSVAVSAASLVAAGKMQAHDALLPCLAGLTTNTVTKAVFAMVTGGRRFALQVIPGLLLVIAGVWIPALPLFSH
ncbi:MAG: MgtC/SapB family protein [Acidobacteria bacterium]|jgi:uncharacterized membrane protein (DUF4010 family)|nr:MgtC/SapB family protein [Acidobacteriota bacterium]